MKNNKKYTFINWAKNVVSRPKNYFQPQTEDQLIEIIKSNTKIRITGTGHSWSDVCKTDETLINLDAYNRVLEIDKIAKTIRVQAGIKLWQLNDVLDKEGLALQNLGSIDRQSIAGVIATGTHGTGMQFQIIAAQVLEITCINAQGVKQILAKEKDANLLNAYIVNLGCLGMISELKLQAVDAFQLHDITTTLPFDDVIENLNTLVQNNDHLKIWWLMPSTEVAVFRYMRTYEKRNDTRIRQFLKDEFLSVFVYRFLVGCCKLFPKWSKSVNRFLTWNLKGPLDRIEKSFKVFVVPEPPLHRETEWAFDFTQAKEILVAYKKWLIESNFPMNFIQEIRFTKGDDFWLSGSYGRDSIWIGFYAYDHENWDSILKAFEQFAIRYNGRPHWGKEFTVGKDYLQKCYPKYLDFIALRKAQDPQNKFSNGFIEKYFS